MASPPPGWYDDPAGSQRLRYWDGERWTDHLADRPAPGEDLDVDGQARFWPFGGGPAGPGVGAPGVDAPPGSGVPPGASGPPHDADRREPARARLGAPDQARPDGPLAPGPTYRVAGPVSGRLAADGTPLAPWWRRLLAWLVDDLICTILALPATIAILASRWDQLDGWYRSVQAAAAQGTEMPTAPDSLLAVVGAAGVASTLVYFLYELIGLSRFGTTWGRRLLHIRVRVAGQGGPLSLEAAGRRSGVKVAGQVAGGAPVLSTLGLLFMLVDLGRGVVDRDRRTIHDLAGGTDVVLVPRMAPARQGPASSATPAARVGDSASRDSRRG